MKFSLRQMFLAVIGGTIAAYIGLSLWAVLNGNYDEISRRLFAHPKIYDVNIWTEGEGLADIATDVLFVEFKIVGRPHSIVALASPKADLFTNANSIALMRIGDIYIHTAYGPDAGGVRAWSSAADIGPDSMYQSVLPRTVKNLDELIDNYDEFLAALSKWPTEDQKGVINISPTEWIEYWATR